LTLEILEERTLLTNAGSPPANVVPISWQGQNDYAVAGQWVARFDGLSGPAAAQMQSLQSLLDNTGLGLQVMQQLGLNGLVLLQGPPDETAALVQTLARLPGYRYVEPNFYEPSAALDTIPNDTYFNLQYALRNTGQTINGQAGIAGDDIGATQAWDTTTGSTAVIVADIDSGIDYNHPDLYQNIWINQAEIPASRLRNLVDVDGDGLITFHDLNNPINQGPGKITDINGDGRMDAEDILAPMILDSQGNDTGLGGWAYPGNTQDGDTAHPNDFVGWNFVADNNRPFDDFFHGTHSSGIIGALGNNGQGIAGVNWNLQLMADKWIDSTGAGTTANAIAAVIYSVNHNAPVSNNSWQVAEDSQGLYDAIDYARSSGDLFVTAAGNAGQNTDTNPNYPASYVRTLDNIISVAATDNRDAKAGFSNWGLQTVNLGAPGVDIFSTTPTAGNAAYGIQPNYDYVSGTSAAAAYVSGAAALILSIAPSASYQVVRQAIFDSVDPIAALRIDGPTPVSTGGRLDLFRLLDEFTPAGPVVIASSPSGNSAAAPIDHVRFTFDEPIDPTTFTADQVVNFTDPEGHAIPIDAIQPVGGSDNTAFDVFFSAVTLPGRYVMVIGPDILDVAGNPMDQNRNGIPGEVPGDQYTAQFTIQGPAVVSTTLVGTFEHLVVDQGRYVFNTPIDPNSFTVDQFSLLDPNGNAVPIISITPVAGTNDTQYEVTFVPQSALGEYVATVSGAVTDFFGNPLVGPFTSRFRMVNDLIGDGGIGEGGVTEPPQFGDLGNSDLGFTLVGDSPPPPAPRGGGIGAVNYAAQAGGWGNGLTGLGLASSASRVELQASWKAMRALLVDEALATVTAMDSTSPFNWRPVFSGINNPLASDQLLGGVSFL
jgi:subtilisin family serine protease